MLEAAFVLGARCKDFAVEGKAAGGPVIRYRQRQTTLMRHTVPIPTSFRRCGGCVLFLPACKVLKSPLQFFASVFGQPKSPFFKGDALRHD